MVSITFISGLTTWLIVVTVFILLPVTASQLGESCTINSNCSTTSNAECNTTAKKCQCTENFYDSNGDTDGGTCVAKLGGSCNSNSDCGGNNVECSSNLCKCSSGFYDDNGVTDGGSCVAKLGGSCNSNSDCGGNNVECSSNLCKCSSGFYDDNGVTDGGSCVAISTVNFNAVCDISAVCDTSKSLECVGVTTKTCKCKTGLYYHSGTCTNNHITNLRVLNLQATATSQTQIRVNWTLPAHVLAINRFEVLWTDNAVPVNLTSQVTTYTIDNLTSGKSYNVLVTSVDTTSTLTEQKVRPPQVTATTDALKGFDESCSITLKCDGLKNLGCQQSKCKCILNHYYDGNTCSSTLSSLKVRSPNAVADSQTQVTVTWFSPTAVTAVDAIEVSWTPVHGESQPQSLSSISTRTVITGLQGETDYTITITSKDTTSGSTTILQSVTATVKTKSALGGFCSSPNNCDGPYVECYNSKCQCQANFYDNNNAAAGGTCKAISELKSKNVQVTAINTTSVTLTWANPIATSYNVIESKQVRITGTTTGSLPDSGSKDVLITDTSTTVTGLTPGGSFSITVVSTDTNSRHIQQEVASDAVSVTTKPAVPGKIGSVVPDNTGYRVALSWIGSVGVVRSYRVVFEGGNGDTRTQDSSTNNITMTSLTPGKRYNITITAISGSMTSDPRYNNTRTTVIAPGAPTNLSCISIMDTNVTLGWTPPVNPNGDIMYYIINVISGPGSPKTVNTTKPVKTQEIDKLTEDSYYSFTIRARNDLYDGPTSLSATCKTKPGLPSKPQNLSTVTVQSRSLTVGWMKPNATKGSLIGYRIIVKNGTTCSKEILYQCSNCEKKPNLTSSCSMKSKTMVAITNTGLTNESFIQTVEGLFPYVSYSVLVYAITGAGDGYSGAVTVETNEEAPQNLTQVPADVLNSTAIKLSWSIQDPRPGKTTYIIYLYDVINEKQTLNKSIEVLGFYERSTILTNLEEYWQYVINIKASTNKGQSAMKTVKPEKTKPAAPGKVANFMVSRPEWNYKSVTISWSIPSLRDQNSLITSYEFKHNATGTVASKILSQSLNNGDGFTESIEVQLENYYYIEVYAINNQNQTGVKSSELYYAPPGPPPKLDSSPDIKVIQNDVKSKTKEITATILLYRNQFTADENGQIINNGIILCPAKTQITTQRQYTDYDKFTTWKKAKNDGFKQCYKPTNSSWLQNSKKVIIQKRSTHEYISYTIGEDTTCDQKPENSYCNGPLNPGTSYKVYTFVCTKGGCTESQSITITTKGTENTSGLIGAVAGPIVAVVVITPAVIVIIIKIKRRNNRAKTGKDATYDDLQMSPYMNQGRVNDEDKTYTSLCEQNKINRYRPFNLSDIRQKVTEMHKDSDLKFAKEFQDLEILSPKDQCQTANLQSNRRKNRNGNVLPFDGSRVMFTEEKNNYINASYLQNFRNKSGQDFIVTQHPLSNTIEDFWTMIWEQNVSVIVMLTPQNDDCKISYEKYFPSEPQSSKQYGSVNLETMAKWCIPMTEFSTIKLKKGKKSRMIKHFRSLCMNDLYDGTMQTEMFHLIDAVKSNISSTDQLGPIVVHCSLGTGRSGVFIALYQLIDCINENTVDIFDLVLTMRESRMNLIENERQYIFIHECFLHSTNDTKTRQRSSLSQVTGDTYEYIHVHELRT